MVKFKIWRFITKVCLPKDLQPEIFETVRLYQWRKFMKLQREAIEDVTGINKAMMGED